MMASCITKDGGQMTCINEIQTQSIIFCRADKPGTILFCSVGIFIATKRTVVTGRFWPTADDQPSENIIILP